ncbi:hypothetical protein R3P38DRAFT_1294190 [Favolaschia claudopus]|uniref:Uncharacterized protein n=1 Tax=Favolaschia claudopus TaxID=2862362 RepID=A0AAW0B0Y2_9AGAR
MNGSRQFFFGTLILNVNVGFLAILTDDDGLAQLLSYVSVSFSLASILSALVLSPTYHGGAHNLQQSQVELSNKPRIIQVGYRRWASIYALPFALMTWGAILFPVAFFVFTGGILPLVLISYLLMFLVVLFGWEKIAWLKWLRFRRNTMKRTVHPL